MPEREALRVRAVRAVRIVHDPPLPAAFLHYQLALPSAPGVDAVAAAVGMSGDDPDGLLSRAAARHWWSADHGQLPLRLASSGELAAAGWPRLPAERLGLADPALLTEPGCPLEAPDPDRRHAWVPARLLREPCAAEEGTPGWVPYSLAFPRWQDTRAEEPRTHPPFFAGIGAGTDVAEASADAWAQLRAQDALWAWWSDPRAPSPFPLAPSAQIAALCEGGGPLRLQLGHIPAPLGGRAVLARAEAEGLSALGAACGPEEAAQRAAVAGALWQLVVARALDDPGDALHRSGVAGLSPYRADRAYLAAAGPRRRRLLDPLGHVQLLLDPILQAEIARRFAQRAEPAAAAEPAASRAPVGGVWRVRLSPAGSAGGTVCVRLLVPAARTLPLGAFPPEPSAGEQRAARPEGLPYPGW